MTHQNVYAQNTVTGATPNPFMPTPDAIDEEFVQAANKTLSRAVELVRDLIGAHQSAIAINQDWHYVRKFFLLSEKCRAWADRLQHTRRRVRLPRLAAGTQRPGTLHARRPHSNRAPPGKILASENGKHPPMRGWMAAPILDEAGKDWGLIAI